ncbi:MAG: fused response regulator/phosphatase [Planctomycetota bacterium]|mgnify:CR=1 FL=1
MPDLNTCALDFLRCFNRTVRSLKMYKATHPQVQRDSDAAFAALQSMLALQDPILIGATGGVFLVQGRPVKGDVAALKAFSEILGEKNIASFKAARGASKEEFAQLAHILFMEPEDALQDDAIKPELLAGLRSLQINEVRFGAAAAVPPSGGAVATGLTVESASALAEAYMRAREDPQATLDGLFQEMKKQGTLEAVVEFFEKAGPELARLPAETASGKARQYLEEAADNYLTLKGVAELRNSILKTILSMSHDVRRLALGESLTETAILDAFRLLRRLDLKIRASALAADLVGGKVDPERMCSVMESLAPSPEEYVRLCEMAAAKIHPANDPAAIAQALSRLFRALKAQAKVPEPAAQGTLMVLDPEAIGEGGYAGGLEEAGYVVIRHGDGGEALRELCERNDVQCLVLEIKLPGLSGLEVLTGLEDARRAIPVVVVTEHAGFQDAFEVASHPRLRYLTKPADIGALMAAVEELVPPPAPREAPPATPAELARAREIQARMAPAPAPTIDGYDLALRHQPTAGLGGDYVDIIPIGGGRTGIAVADVSAHDPAGAMVMTYLRAVLRMAASRGGGAKETLVEVNRCLAKEMPKGLSVSAVYAVLDPAAHVLTVAGAGCRAPLLWTKDFGIASFLPAGKAPLGKVAGTGFEESIREEEVQLAPRDRLLLYTDGLIEARDAKGAPFAEKRLLKLVNFGGEKSSAALVDEVVGELSRHRGACEPTDDVSILCLTRGA